MNWQALYDRLDRVSRQRALTMGESLLLERAIAMIDGPHESAVTAVGPDSAGSRSGWSEDEERRFAAYIRGGMSIGAAAVAIGKTRGAGAGKWRRMQAA